MTATDGITAVTVDRDDDDLVVRWTGDVNGPVAVCVGLAPDAIDHEHPSAIVHPDANHHDDDHDHGNEARLTGLGRGGRHYVHVGPSADNANNDPRATGIVAAERLVPLEGTLNFRDLGGYATTAGSRVRWGQLFRSDGLQGLTDPDHELLTAMGIRTVCDLRWDRERDAQPSRLPADGVTVHHFSVGRDPQGDDMIERIFAGEVDEVTVEWMADIYLQMLDEGASAFVALLTHLAEPDALPAVFHCAAGKDRTGLSAALLLRLLDVPEDVVLDDYELSNTYRAQRRIDELRPRFAEAGLDIERFRDYLSAPRPVLARALDHIERDHGGVEPYLLAAGMAATVPAQLRQRLLDPSP